MIKKVSIYGLGNFGYAILKHIDKKFGEDISLHAYDRNKKLIECLKKERRHLFLHKDIKISKNVSFESNIKILLYDCDVLILAITSNSTKEVIQNIKKHIHKKLIIINTAKALDYQTGSRLSEIIKKELSGISYEYALLAGGIIAKELFDHEPLGTDIACENKKTLPILVDFLQSKNLYVYPTTDLIGAEYASAFKNVVSILAGIMEGMNFSYGSQTHIISRVAYEVERLVINKLGGDKETFRMKSQCWSSDLWMSCTSNTRNREFGVLLGRGKSVDDAIFEMRKKGKTVEGLNTIKCLQNIIDINYPLLQFLYDYVYLKSDNLHTLKQLIFNHKY